MPVLLDQDFSKDARKNCAMALFNKCFSQNPIPTISHNTNQLAAHPFHHLLTDANDGK
jgi:hypothetical protein